GRAPPAQADSRSITPRELRMKHDLGAPDGRPPHGLGIAPALVADRDAEPGPVDLEELPGRSGHVERVFARIELVLRLISLDLPPRVDDAGGDLPARLRDALHPEDRRHAVRSRQLRDGREHPLLLGALEGLDLEVLPA